MYQVESESLTRNIYFLQYWQNDMLFKAESLIKSEHSQTGNKINAVFKLRASILYYSKISEMWKYVKQTMRCISQIRKH